MLDDDGGLGRLSGLVGPLNWRVGLVVGLALLTGAGATLATADFGGTAEPEELTARIETDALPAVGGQTASTLDQAGSTDPELLQSDGVLASLAVDESDDTTSTTDPTTSTSDPSTTSDPSSTTSTTLPGVSAPANDASGSTSTTDSSSSTTSGGTSTSGATTSERTTTSRGTTGSSTTSRQTTTTRQGTTQATTATTRATTTTTRPTTTTTVQTTTTAQPTTTQAGNSCATGAEFELIMRDDFNGSSIGGQWLQWNQSAGNRGNGLRMASALNVSSGVLTITANMQDGTLISGGLNHTVAQTYGKYRVRVRTDVDPSRAMSGVVLTWPASNVHPRDGENNMYETLPHQDSATRNPFYTFIHKPFGGTGDQEYKIWRADAAQWQTMTMEWTPSRITVTRDGGESWTVNETGADLIPDVPHRFHMQLDAFQSSISSQVTMQVDFAEVYRYCG
ncbi:MAG: glycoside hydrolase family 16 protein [Actinomycetota bacterium]